MEHSWTGSGTAEQGINQEAPTPHGVYCIMVNIQFKHFKPGYLGWPTEPECVISAVNLTFQMSKYPAV